MSVNISEYNSKYMPTWCMGCGNFAIHTALKKALTDLNIGPSKVFMSFDIGCNGNGADKIEGYRFKGLHGRSIPLAIGAHLANRKYTVLADIGDGGCLHEGLDHLIHAIRSNYDITILIHNNGSFALTTGQATATTIDNKPMYGLPEGRPEREMRIDKLVLNLDPTFYAKAYSQDPLQLSEIIKEGINHKGCSIIEIHQICPTYNPEMNTQWYAQRIKKLEKPFYSPKEALESIEKEEHILTGVYIKNENTPYFYENLQSRKGKETELVDEVKQYDVKNILERYK